MDVTTHMFNPIDITESHKMTQQDALRMALEALNSTGINRGMHGDNQYFDDDLVAKALAACQSALAEQDDEAVGELSIDYQGFFSYKRLKSLPSGYHKLYTSPAPKQYTESDIDVAIGSVDWANTSWQQAAVEAKKLVMRFVGSQVTMEEARRDAERKGLLEAARLIRMWASDPDISRIQETARDAARKLYFWPEWLEEAARDASLNIKGGV